MTLRIIITGGTFDKKYDEIQGVLSFQQTHLPAILDQVRLTLPVALEIDQLMDSLDMEDHHRRQVVDACCRAPEPWIVITHGTDTMAETARLLAAEELDKSIVLTGAMIPYSVTGSDSLFNLGSAIGAVQLLPAGVFIAMNGRIFAWDDVRKNRQAGIFETISGAASLTWRVADAADPFTSSPHRNENP